MKKLLSSVILSAIIVSSFASLTACTSEQTGGDGGNVAASTTAAGDEAVDEVTEEERISDDIPELDFGGATYRIVSPRANYFDGRITVAEQTGEVLDDALYSRSREIEERFHILFDETPIDGDTNVTAAVNTAVLSGDDLYDTAMVMERDALVLAQNKYIIPIGDLEYINLDKPWWVKKVNDKMTIANKLWFALSDLSLTGLSYTAPLVYNVNMVEEFNLENPVELLHNGTWTQEKFLSMGQTVTADLNGDGQWSGADRYGLTTAAKNVLPSFWMAAGVQTVSKDADDIPYFSLEGDEKFATVFEAIYKLTWDSGIWYDPATDDTKNMFEDGKSLFAGSSVALSDAMRNMEDDFGYLVYPKYTEEQDEYYTRLGGGYQVSVVPSTAQELEMIGAIIEATAAASHYTVIPAYYEINLKQKFARDQASIEMLDFIMEHRTIDLGDTLWCSQIRDGFLRLNFIANDRNLASAIAANRAKIDSTIDAAVTAFTE